MTKRILGFLFSFYFSLNIFSLYAKNEDTPNLSFEMGNFSGWNLYTGQYYYDDNNTTIPYTPRGTNTYKAAWTPVTSAGAGGRFQIMGTMPNTNDPIVACSGFFVNPDGMPSVARIGVPKAAEGYATAASSCSGRNKWTTGKYATAERMTYTFTVTPQTTLLVYKFAAVLRDPTSGGTHEGEERPAYSLSVKLDDGSALPCSSFDGKADLNASGFERNKGTSGTNSCPSGGGNEYVYKNWTTGMINLLPHLGRTVTIEIETHDCIVQCAQNGTTYRVSGSHEAYGYFWGETLGLKLEAKNCVGEDAYITATDTEGFLTYTWRRSDGKPIATVPGSPNIARIPQADLDPGVTYYCEMNGDMGCPPITLSTQLPKIVINPDFSYENDCSGKVEFTNESTISNDTIRFYSWDFGDGTVSDLKNPVHFYPAPGLYQVTLKTISSSGCESSVTKPVAVRYFPDLDIDGSDVVCYGEKVILSVMEAEVGSGFLWDNGSTLQTMIDTAKTSKNYTVTVTDQYSCSYTKTIYISVKPTPTLLISGDTEICLNDTATLKATGALTYVWNNGAATAQTKVRPLADETFTVSGTAANGCTSTKDILVKVNPLPDVSISGVDEVCKNSTAILTAQGAASYYWSDLFTGASRIVAPLRDTVYTVTGADANGCKSSYTKSIRVKNNPELSFSGDTIVCLGDMVQLTARGASSYVWFDGSVSETLTKIPTRDTIYWFDGTTDGCTVRKHIQIRVLSRPALWVDGNRMICENDVLKLKAGGADHYQWSTGSTQDSIQATPLASTVYQVKGFYNNGCSGILDVNITVRPLPIVLINGPVSTCENSQVTLTAQGDNLLYTWDTGSLNPSISPNITGLKTFTVAGRDTFGCVGSASHTVESIPHPLLSYDGKTDVCDGEMLTIAAQGASSYVWHDGTTSGVYKKIPKEDTIYTVEGTLNGCTSKLNIPIRVLPLPSIWIEGKTEICVGDAVNLKAKGGDTYKWNSGAVTDEIIDTPSASTSYQVQGFGLNGCTSIVSASVTVHSKPVISISGLKNVCEDNYVTLTAVGTASTYTWSNGIIDTEITPLITTGSHTFTVTGTDSNSCKNTATHTVAALTPPVLTSQGKTTICEGETVTLAILGGATSYVWHDGTTSGVYTKRPAGDTIYTVTGTLNGCTTQLDIPITVLPSPLIWVEGITSICSGDSLFLTAKGGDSYLWNTGATTATIGELPSTSTSYQVQGFSTEGCTSLYSVDITVRPNPVVKISGETNVCENSYVTLTAQGNASTYAWSNGIIASSITPLIAANSTFTLTGTDAAGCSATTIHTVNALPLPVLTYQGKTAICEGQYVTLAVQGATSYLWQNGSTSGVFSDNPENTTTYTVEGKMNGCSGKLDILVEVLPVPTIWVEGEREICSGGTVHLKAQGADTYQWANGTTGDLMEDTPQYTTTYQVQGIGANSCSATTSVTVKINPNPVVKISGETSVCENSYVTLTAQGTASNYSWSNGSAASSITPLIPSGGSTFKLVGTDITGCTSVDSITIKALPLPVLTNTGNTKICKGQYVTLAVQGAMSYLWQDGSTSGVYTGNPENTTLYTVEGEMNGCKSKLDILVEILPVPTVWIDGEREICSGETVRLKAQGADTYQWATGTTGDLMEDTPQYTTTYQVQGIGANSCFATTSVSVTVHPKPFVNISGETNVCENNYTTLTATGDAISYLWDNGTPYASIQPFITANTTFKVKGTSAFGCEDSSMVTVNSLPLPVITYTGDDTICGGQAVVLAAQGANSYLWHDGSTSGIYTNIPKQDTIYKVTGTLNGCSSTLTIPIHVLPFPSIWIDSRPAEICAGESVQLQANGALEYYWSTGANTDIIEDTPLFSTTYKVQGIGANGCSSSSSLLLTVHPKPIVEVDGDNTVCKGSFATLTVSGNAISYMWSNGMPDPSIYPYPTDKTTYSVTGTSQFGCKTTKEHTVDVRPLPVLSYQGKTSVCQGQIATILMQGATSYLWYDGSVSGTYSRIPDSDTIYSVTGTLDGCTSKINIPVHVFSLPFVTVEGDKTVCSGESLRLKAKGADTYQWSTGDVTDSLVVKPLTSTTYQLQGTDTNGCYKSISVDITVFPKPKINITAEDEVCENTSVTLTAQGDADEYYWDNGYVGGVIHPVVDKTTVYSVRGVNSYECSSTASHRVNTIALPDLSYIGDTDVCLGETLTLVAQGASSYIWSDGTTSPVFKKTPVGSGQVTMIGMIADCSSILEIPITVLIPPSVYITGDSAVCENSPFRLRATGADWYEWSTGDKTASISYSIKEPKTYYVTGRSNNGCTATESMEVGILSLPKVRLKQDDIFGCFGVPDTVILSASGAKTYTWSSEPYDWSINEKTESRIRFEIDRDTYVFVEGENEDGCVASDSIIVRKLIHPEFIFTVTPDVIEGNSTTVRFKGVSPPANQWYWTPGDGTYERIGNDLSHTYSAMEVDSFQVSVRSIDARGCVFEGETWIYSWRGFWAPDAFTPDNDKVNDTFHFIGDDYITDFSYIIYNRLGEIVFTGHSMSDAWDGTYKGEPCPWGIYGWVANYKSNHKGLHKEGDRKGFITLIR